MSFLDPPPWCSDTSAAHSCKGAWTICSIAPTKVNRLATLREPAADLLLIQNPESLTSISYVAVEPVRAVPVAGCLNERHITGIATKRQHQTRVPEPRDRDE